MNGLLRALWVSGCAVLLHAQAVAQPANVKLHADSVLAIASDAYLYAMPLVYTDATRVKTDIPDNAFEHLKVFPDHTFKAVVKPNNDTNYSLAFLQLQDDAVVIDIPDTKGRYYVVPFSDGWTNYFSIVGKRTTGTKAQRYVVTGPNWKGTVPKGLTEVKSPTNLVWIISRIQVNSKKDQQEFVGPLQDQLKLTSLSKWEKKDYSDSKTVKKVYFSWKQEQFSKGVVDAIQQLSIEEYFNYFNALLADNPPYAADSAVIDRISKIGIGKDLRFSKTYFDEETQIALDSVASSVYQKLHSIRSDSNFKLPKKPKYGDYGTDYLFRATVAYFGIGALPPSEAVYYEIRRDSDKKLLDGKNSYVIRYEKDQLPPANAFWSLTVYDARGYLSDNEIKRYAIGDRDNLRFNADGSLDIHLGNSKPTDDKVSNWLPAPADTFTLSLRVYVPDEQIVENRYSWNNPEPRKIAD